MCCFMFHFIFLKIYSFVCYIFVFVHLNITLAIPQAFTWSLIIYLLRVGNWNRMTFLCNVCSPWEIRGWFCCSKALMEPAHKIMVLFVLRKLILHTRMRSHPMGLDVRFLARLFICFHTSCVRTANALARLRGCAGSFEPSLVAYVISAIISWAGSIMIWNYWLSTSSLKLSSAWSTKNGLSCHFYHCQYILTCTRNDKQSMTVFNISFYFLISSLFWKSHWFADNFVRSLRQEHRWQFKLIVTIGIRAFSYVWHKYI